MSVVLEEVEVRELVSGKKRLIYVDVGDSLDTALALLQEDNVLAVPVRSVEPPKKKDDGTEGPRELKFCGLLSVLDIASFVAREPGAGDEGGQGVTVGQAFKKTAESWHMLLLDPHAKVARAMEYLGVRGFHRALVPNVCLSEHAVDAVPLPSALAEELTPTARGEEYRVLSQMDLARFLMAYESRFGLALSQSLEAVGLEGGRVLATTKDEKLSDALERMAGHAVSALAVVERLENGAPWADSGAALVDTLSASDLRGSSLVHLKAAKNTTVGEFLAERHGAAPRKLLTCTKASELRHVLKDMVDHGVHRLWVTPEKDPTSPEAPLPVQGVVTLSDIVRIMRILPPTNNPEGAEDLVNMAIDRFMWMEWMT